MIQTITIVVEDGLRVYGSIAGAPDLLLAEQAIAVYLKSIRAAVAQMAATLDGARHENKT